MERSFGILPLKRSEQGWKTLLVKHQKGHWAFPKGHPDPHEAPLACAKRELKEETGLEVKNVLFDEPLEENYTFEREGETIQKRVTYFVAEVEGEVALQPEEIADFKWLSFEEAADVATFPECRSLISLLRGLVE